MLWVSAEGAAGYASYRPGPQGLCLVRKPTLAWNVQGTDGTRVTGWAMTINGKAVTAFYSKDEGAVVYEPSKALEPGEYSVQVSIELDNKYKAEKSWTFRVAPTAVDLLPEPNNLQKEAVDAVNEFRKVLGLPEYYLDPVLCASSQAHARFMKTNNVFGHYQKEGMSEFVGAKPIERAQAYGHRGGLWEDVAWANETPQGFIQQLFDAPYHRIPFMQPGYTGVGAGFEERLACIDFGSGTKQGFVVSPAPDQVDVPPSWDGIETPTPLRLHGLKGPVGYVIVAAFFSQENEKIVLDSATLSCGGNPVDIATNSPANDDHLTNAVLILPKAELRPGTTYEASISLHTESGKKLSKTWSFKTK
jgi:uncharacterized protein YkwD